MGSNCGTGLHYKTMPLHVSDKMLMGCMQQVDTLQLSAGPTQCCPGLWWRGDRGALAYRMLHILTKYGHWEPFPAHYLILPEEDFGGQHRLADVTSHTAGLQGDQGTHLPQLGHHNQDVAAEGRADHLGGDSAHHRSLLLGRQQGFTFHCGVCSVAPYIYLKKKKSKSIDGR